MISLHIFSVNCGIAPDQKILKHWFIDCFSLLEKHSRRCSRRNHSTHALESKGHRGVLTAARCIVFNGRDERVKGQTYYQVCTSKQLLFLRDSRKSNFKIEKKKKKGQHLYCTFPVILIYSLTDITSPEPLHN